MKLIVIHSLLLAILLQTVALASEAESMPSIVGQTYEEARKAILRARWQPLEKQDFSEEERASGEVSSFLARGYKEVEICSGTGRGYCVFNFSRDGNCLRVVTAGEEAASLNIHAHVVSVTAECPNSAKY